ncbi:MAG: glycosyltransferase family 1 protein [Patescibacteria group bacterium]
MRIGIDCRTILSPGAGEAAGVGHYTHFLVKNLIDLGQDHVFVLFFDKRFRGVNEFKNYKNVEIRFFPFYQYKKYLPLAYSQMLISAFLSRERLDVFHSPANTTPLLYKRPSVVTVHDLAIYKYPRFFPSTFLNRQTFATKVLVPSSLTRAEKIIAISKNTKRDIIEEFGIEENKIEVVYNGVTIDSKDCPGDGEFKNLKKKYGLTDNYVLFVGTIEPRKNLINLVKAFRNLKLVYDSPIKDCQLIIAGASGWSNEGIFEAIADANASIIGQKKRRSGKERRSGFDIRSEAKKGKQGERRHDFDRRFGQPIKHLGYISYCEKILILKHATCFVFPSLYEGFGLPILEAMSLGVPVITSNVSSLPEVAGEDNALLVNPNKESEIADALQQIFTDSGLRESLAVNGQERAKEFNWKKCAEETLAVYEAVAAKANKSNSVS